MLVLNSDPRKRGVEESLTSVRAPIPTSHTIDTSRKEFAQEE